jgi:hypothetical protein
MPRFHPQLATTVFYLYGRDLRGDMAGPWGTGVFVVKKPNRHGCPNHTYAVTAYHVAISSGASSIRVNVLENGGATLRTEFIEKDPSQWHFVPGGDDIAAIDVTEDFRRISRTFIRGVPTTDLITPEFINDAELSLGEDGFMLGLFSEQPGLYFNLPSARFGNLSQLANLVHPIEQGHGIARPSHIFDMHSRPGFSGSPVFVFRTPMSDLTNIQEDGTYVLDLGDFTNTKHNAFVKMLGIHSGQFVENIKTKKAEAGANGHATLQPEFITFNNRFEGKWSERRWLRPNIAKRPGRPVRRQPSAFSFDR